MLINIESGGSGLDTKLSWADGTEIRGVKCLDLQIAVDQPNTAMIQFCAPTVQAIAECRMSDKHLAELAEAHGFTLTKIEQ